MYKNNQIGRTNSAPYVPHMFGFLRWLFTIIQQWKLRLNTIKLRLFTFKSFDHKQYSPSQGAHEKKQACMNIYIYIYIVGGWLCGTNDQLNANLVVWMNYVQLTFAYIISAFN